MKRLDLSAVSVTGMPLDTPPDFAGVADVITVGTAGPDGWHAITDDLGVKIHAATEELAAWIQRMIAQHERAA